MAKPSPTKPSPKIPLRIVLIAPFVLLIVLAVGLVGYLSFFNGQQAVNTVAGQLRGEITARIEEHLHTFLETPHLINQINATLLRQDELKANDANALERHFWQQIQIFDSVTSIYFGNSAGGLVNAGREGATDARYVIVTDGFVSGPFHKYATDSRGKRTELLTTVPDFDARKRPWYTGAMARGDAVWSEIYILFTGQDMAIAASRPVYDDQQRLLGVVSVDIFLSHLSNFLRSIEVGETGQSFIIDRAGLLVAVSTAEQPFTEPAQDGVRRRLQASDSAIPLVRSAARFLTAQFGDYHHITTAQQLEFELDGERQFLQVAPVQDNYGLDWLIVVVAPESDFMAQIQANNRLTIILIGVALLLAVGVGVVTARWISGPILRLNASAQALAKGEWRQIATVDWIGELSELTSSFNRMAGQLQQTVAKLTAEIAERKRAEESLRESEERLQLALKGADLGTWDWNITTGDVVFNERWAEMLGYNLAEIEPHISTWEKLVHPDDATAVMEVLNAHLSGRTPIYQTEHRLRTKAGDWKWILDTGKVFERAEQSQPLRAAGTHQDITARKKAEAGLRQQNNFLAALHHIALDLLNHREMDDLFQFIAESATAILDAPHCELSLKEDDELVVRAFTPNQSFLLGDRVRRGEAVLSWQAHDTGRPVIIDDYSSWPHHRPIYDNISLRAVADFPILIGQDCLGVLGVGRFEPGYKFTPEQIQKGILFSQLAALALDNNHLYTAALREIAERKQVEEALRESNQRLQETLAELEQTQAHLVQQERLAAVGQLAAGVAHDFNNILTSILGFAELLQLSPDTPETAREDVGRIISSGQRAARLIRQLLDFSRKSIHRPQQLKLIPFLNETIRFFQWAIPENIRLSLEIESGEFLVEADPVQLQQMLTNLVINARDAMPTGGELKLKIAGVEAKGEAICVGCNQAIEGEWVALVVSDTGSGIPAELLPRIFEPFFTTKEVGQGSGLGLAQVLGIVQQQAGHITVASQDGQGTTFTVYLPPLEPRQSNAEPAEPILLQQGQGETILLVEDDPTVLAVTGTMLEHLGYQILTATNGREALAVYEEHQAVIALVLSDIVMPDMEGDALFNFLKAQNDSIKMVLMSGYPLDREGALLLEQGVVEWLQKPLSLRGLGQVISRVLDKK